ncbi:MAG: ABC transporter substrate-binding protein [Mycobacteriales bacterium]
MPATVRARAALLLVLALLATGCDRGRPEPVGKGVLTVGAGPRLESQVIARMYALALNKAGYRVTGQFDVQTRAAYLPALQRGELDLVPDYLSGLTGYLDAAAHGAAAARRPLASGDVDRTLRALRGQLAGRPLAVGPPAKATDQVAYAVTKRLADQQQLTSMADLARLNGQLVLGGPADCGTVRYCLPGLQAVYGLRFKEVRALGEVSSRPVFAALQEGKVDVGAVRSSAGGVAAASLVVLRDDRRLQQAENIVPLYRDSVPPDARAVVEGVNRALTTEKLQELNKRVEMDGQDPGSLAKRFLQDARLL